jgi:hypothetical protein
MKDGLLIVTEDGYGQIGAGHGFQIINGVGLLIIMADGGIRMLMDGFGRREEYGVQVGSTGAVTKNILAGILFHPEIIGDTEDFHTLIIIFIIMVGLLQGRTILQII